MNNEKMTLGEVLAQDLALKSMKRFLGYTPMNIHYYRIEVDDRIGNNDPHKAKFKHYT